MYTFILVHGSWKDGSQWDHVIKHLEKKGHTAYAPTIAGHGQGVDRNVNHAQCTQSIVNFIIDNDINNFVLVGHSFGGTIISKVAEAVPERIRRLVFISAFVLNDGESVFDNQSPNVQEIFRNAAKASEDNTIMFPFEIWYERFMKDADLGFAKSVYGQLYPEPFQPIIDKLDMKKFYSLKIPKSYIHCSEDMAVGEGGFHPRMSNRLGQYRFVQMTGDHTVIRTNPKETADKIIEASRD